MAKRFEAIMLVEGDDTASCSDLTAALRHILERAVRFSPDRRFNWNIPDLTVDEYDPRLTERAPRK